MNSVKMLCETCHKFLNQKSLKNCDFCARLNFPEDILCQLTRSEAEGSILSECGAFRQKLILLDKDKSGKSIEAETINDDNFVSSDKAKWFEAYAKQQLQADSDQMYFKLRFHICLVTNKRNKIFSSANEYIAKMTDIFNQIGGMFEQTQVEILYLSEDHIHLYTDTTPDYSIDEIINRVISNSEQEILSVFSELRSKYKKIWENNYFAESIG